MKSRRRRSLLPIGSACLVACLSGCGNPLDLALLGGSGDSPPGVGGEPRIGVSVVRARDLGALEQPRSVLARDGGLSGAFGGRAVWLYGDTLFDTGQSRGMISNSWDWTDDLDATNGIRLVHPEVAGGPAPFLLETDAEREFDSAHAGEACREKPCGARWALWPEALVPDPARSRVLVFYGKVYAEAGVFNFWNAGQSIAVWSTFDAHPDRGIDPRTGEATVILPEPALSNGRIVEGDVLYAYGCETDGLSKPCRVGRVPLDRALRPSAWTYYSSAHGWTSDLSEATPVLEGNDIMSVAYNAYLGAYLAVYAPPLANEVDMRVAPRPEGPWSPPVRAFSTATPAELWVYDAQAHPDYERDAGRIQYVTYSLATSATTSEMRLVEVEIGGYRSPRLTSVAR